MPTIPAWVLLLLMNSPSDTNRDQTVARSTDSKGCSAAIGAEGAAERPCADVSAGRRKGGDVRYNAEEPTTRKPTVTQPVTWWLKTTATTQPSASANDLPILGRSASIETRRR